MVKFERQKHNNGEIWETNVTKEKFYATKKSIKIWDINVDNIVTSNLVKAKTNSKYLIWYSDKLSEYAKTFKVEDKNNKLMSFFINDKK